jgi:hypothetical protein
MDHPARGQIIATGDLGFACLAASQAPALLQKPWPGGTVNRSVHASTAQQGPVGGVDDAVGLKRSDVTFDDGYSFQLA